ncbi:MAG: hypothetical protein CBD18_05560 [Opitutales bacterium TMED158]|nr:MAG: hypothetical protein CBD18_05560 [Opitutales bacterium TMED158]
MARTLLKTLARLLAISLLLGGFCTPGISQSESFEAVLSPPFSIDLNTGEMISTVEAQLNYGNWLLSADEIRYNQNTARAIATGNVVFTRGDIRLVADKLDYQIKAQRARIENFRVGNGRYFLSGALLEGDPNDFKFQDIDFHPGEPGTYLFKARADEIAIVDQSEIRGRRLSFKLGPIPFFIIPNVSQPIDAERNLFKADLDYSGHIGGAIGGEIRVPINSNFRAGANLALTTKRGILAGPAFEYGFEDGENRSSGSFTSGFIDDDASAIEPDLLTGNPIDDERFFAEWQHQQFWGNRGAVNAYGRWWSDVNVTREFYDGSFDTMQDPDTFVEANYSGDDWQATLFTRISPNDFQFYTERLPELRFDLFPTTIAPGIMHQGSVSFAKLKTDLSQAANLDNETDRIDAYYGLKSVKTLAPGIVFSSKAGIKAIHYADNLIGSDPMDLAGLDTFSWAPLTIVDEFTHLTPRPSVKEGTRGYGDIGFNLKFTSYAQTNYKNEVWNIDGLRHVFEPVISYRYTPDLDSAWAHSLQDTPSFANYMTPLDIEDRRDIDTIGEHHISRLALRNRIQTRDKDYGSRDLARIDFAIDYLIDDYDTGADFSDFYTDIEITPAPWLEARLFSRYDFDVSSLQELNTSLAITDPGYWKFGIGNHFLRRQLEQYFLFGEYNLNNDLKLYAVAKYDEASNTFYEQRIGLMQRALEKYGIKYELRIFDGNRIENDFGIRIGIDLFDE